MPEKVRGSPVHRLPDWRLTLPLAQSCPRCGARSRSGAKCKAPAMSNGRCRDAGGRGSGAAYVGRTGTNATIVWMWFCNGSSSPNKPITWHWCLPVLTTSIMTPN